MNKELTYISLFSCAGIGCYGFKEENFECVATNELLNKRLNIQKINNKCKYKSGYICGDIQKEETKQLIKDELKRWNLKGTNINNSLDVLVATPPCQGMSIANRKQNDKEIERNSLVIESIKLIKEIHPNFFVFENVPAFMNTLCVNENNEVLSISDEIAKELGKQYNYAYKIINFKNYGNNSSRTRTLVIGVKKELSNKVIPLELFPDYVEEPTLRSVIGKYKSLEWDELDKNDIWHSFRVYAPEMREWIHGMSEGQSAFDNEDMYKRPHKIVNGEYVLHSRKLSGKYTRNCWDKVAPCIHTRNDQMASQNTIHPVDDRVFSIRELMDIMTIPNSFKWIEEENNINLNELSEKEKRAIIKKNDVNIRQCIGEAVPTNIFKQIANKIKNVLHQISYSDKEILDIILTNKLNDKSNLIKFIKENGSIISYFSMMRICELSNKQRDNTNAYYTNDFLLNEISKSMPDIAKDEINILEPAVGIGALVYLCILKYSNKKLNFYVNDINEDTIDILKVIVDIYFNNNQITFSYFNVDYLEGFRDNHFDLIIANPPFSSEDGKYKNIVHSFIEKSLAISDYVIMITPKNLLNTPLFEDTRNMLENKRLDCIIDFGEYGFKNVLIETICLFIDVKKKPKNTMIKSYTHNFEIEQNQQYFTKKDNIPYWIIYRDAFFDEIYNQLEFNIFNVFRDRQITNSYLSATKQEDMVRVLKSRNINNDGTQVVDISGYDSYIQLSVLKNMSVYEYLNKDVYIVPNMTYNPRMMKLPKDCIVNGSLAILIPKQDIQIDEEDMLYYSCEEFRKFYNIARNKQTRSLNIDKNSVFWYGKRK